MNLKRESDLLALAFGILGDCKHLTSAEQQVLGGITKVKDAAILEGVVSEILSGGDPLGEAFSVVRSANKRRGYGQMFTPDDIVTSMILRARLDAVSHGNFSMVVDPGAGSGRFIRAAGVAFPAAALVAIEADPVCAILLRANLKALGWEDRARVFVQDYREIERIPTCERTLFIGNPPYVRHHDISEYWKAWYAEATEILGTRGSKLAGLHIHFFVKTHLISRQGDLGLFVTSAEWMETKYGAALRSLLVGPMGGSSIHVVDAKSEPFPGVMTTAAITAFRPHTPSDVIRFCKVATSSSLNDLSEGYDTPVEQLICASRWSAEQHILFPPRRVGGTRIGDLFRVSRGQVTGCNNVWVADGRYSTKLPEEYLVPCITSAKEIFDAAEAGGRLTSTSHLNKVVCLPSDIDQEPLKSKKAIKEFLQWARQVGADQSYVAQHRSPWWSVVLQRPAPIVCTYMARKTPAFIRNDAGARILNVAHGLYPKVALSSEDLDEICIALNSAVKLTDGRVYAGGLTKFEPKAVEALVIDWVPDQLREVVTL